MAGRQRTLLDTYQSERYPVGERVMMHSMSQTALFGPGPEIAALRELFNELLQQPSVAEHMAHLLAGSDVRYDVGDDHPLAGRLAPDVTLDDGRRVAETSAPGPSGVARPVRRTRGRSRTRLGRPRRRRGRCRRRLRGTRAVDPTRRLHRLGGKHIRGRRRGPVARRVAEMVRRQRRRARRTTPG